MMPALCASSSAPQTWSRIGRAAIHREGALGAHGLVQVLALEELHDDVERPVLELAVPEDPHGVRVGQVHHGAGLATKARDEVLAIGELRMEDLHPHHALHLALQRLVHGAHPARADLLKDLVLAVQDVASDERILRAHGLTCRPSGITTRLEASSAQAMPLTSKLLSRDGFLHAFSMRGEGDGDLARLLGGGVVVRTKQVHGGLAVEAAAAAGADADAIVARASLPGAVASGSPPAVVVGVQVADCVPVLLANPTTGDVAAVHAGWRGVVAKVVPAAVEVLAPAPGGANLVAAIGPCIGACCFEVGREVAGAIAAACAEPRVVVWEAKDKAYVDLRAAVRAQLQGLGLANARIDDVPGCTKHESERFHSYRRDGADSGRMLAAIAARR